MNNTPAYANVLLTPAKVAPTVGSAKRDTTQANADARAAEFQQTLNRAQNHSQELARSKSAARREAVSQRDDANAAKIAARKEASAAQQNAQKSLKNTQDNNTARRATSGVDQTRSGQTRAEVDAVRERRTLKGDGDLAAEKNTASTKAAAQPTTKTEDEKCAASDLAAPTQFDPLSAAIMAASDASTSASGATEVSLGSDGAESDFAESDFAESDPAEIDLAKRGFAESDISALIAGAPSQQESPLVVDTSSVLGAPAAGADATEQALLVSDLADKSGFPINPSQVQVATAETTGALAAELGDDLAVLADGQPTSAASLKSAVLTTAGDSQPEAEPTAAASAVSMQMQLAKATSEKSAPALSGADADEPLLPSAPANSASAIVDNGLRASDAASPAARSFVVQTAVPVPVGQPQWSQAVGDKVLWLAAQNVSSAEINLHPKDLGPLQVKVSVNQEQTTVSFSSAHLVVREALDQSLNRLRDMFSEQGLNLVNVDVSDQSFNRQQGDAQAQKAQGGLQDARPDEETPIAMSSIMQQRLVDHYA